MWPHNNIHCLRSHLNYLPVLIEPVVSLGLGVKRVAEVAGAGGGDPVHGAVVELEIVDELLVAALVVLLHDAEVSHRCGYKSINMVMSTK